MPIEQQRVTLFEDGWTVINAYPGATADGPIVFECLQGIPRTIVSQTSVDLGSIRPWFALFGATYGLHIPAPPTLEHAWVLLCVIAQEHRRRRGHD